MPKAVLKQILSTFLFLMLITIAHTQGRDTLQLADPTIFYHDKLYYLYGTVEGTTGEGFVAYTSKDQNIWTKSTKTDDGFALRKGDAFGDKGFWAPQMFAYGKRFYMAYVANEEIAIAVAEHPAGPFTQSLKQPLRAPVKQIDPFVYIDGDGRKYLYHVRLDGGNKIYVAELLDDLSGIKEETLRLCITASEPWENTAAAFWPVAEGPTVIKHNGVYYLFYTANDFRNPDYAVGYATSDSPLGPWKKWTGNPVLSRKDVGQNGTGHGDFLQRKPDDWLYVLHTHNSDLKVGPRKTAVITGKFIKGESSEPDVFIFEPATFQYLYRAVN